MDLLTASLDDLLAQASQLVRDAAAGGSGATEHELQVSAIGPRALAGRRGGGDHPPARLAG
ncbi:hypothetical protein [Microbacterium aurum]